VTPSLAQKRGEYLESQLDYTIAEDNTAMEYWQWEVTLLDNYPLQ
jgi:hypothetical protein